MSDPSTPADDSDSVEQSESGTPLRVSGRTVSERVHIAALRAQIEQIQQERNRLAERTDELEAEQETLERTVYKHREQIDELQARCGALEAALAYKDDQRQQVIESYERQLHERRERATATREHGTSRLIGTSQRWAQALREGIRRGSRQLRSALGRFGVS